MSSESTGHTATAPPGGGPPFSLERWVRQCLPRASGNLVDRMVLVALGALHGTDRRWVRPEQISELTELHLDLVVDSLGEAVAAGTVDRVRRGFVPVQLVVEVDLEAQQRREFGLSADCSSCGAAAGDDCTTANRATSWNLHSPRRQIAAKLFNEQQQSMAAA